MIILSNEDGLFKVEDIGGTVVFMEKIGNTPSDWLLQEVSDDMTILKGEIRTPEEERDAQKTQ